MIGIQVAEIGMITANSNKSGSMCGQLRWVQRKPAKNNATKTTSRIQQAAAARSDVQIRSAILVVLTPDKDLCQSKTSDIEPAYLTLPAQACIDASTGSRVSGDKES